MTDLESAQMMMSIARAAGKARYEADSRAVDILRDRADAADDPAVASALLYAAQEIIARNPHP